MSSLSALDKQSPWKDKDPKMLQTIIGNDGEIGAEQHSESKVKNVGVGIQKIVKITKTTLFESN